MELQKVLSKGISSNTTGNRLAQTQGITAVLEEIFLSVSQSQEAISIQNNGMLLTSQDGRMGFINQSLFYNQSALENITEKLASSGMVTGWCWSFCM